MIKKQTHIGSVAVLIPLLVPNFSPPQQDIRFLILNKILPVVDAAVPVVASLALLYFFWGLALFILHADNEDERGKGKKVMVWGTIALFLMFSIFGIVKILSNTFF